MDFIREAGSIIFFIVMVILLGTMFNRHGGPG